MINIAVLFGGKSTEHEVSIISAIQAIENLDNNKYFVMPIYISKNGDFYYNKENLFRDIKNFKDTKSLLSKSEKIIFVKDDNKTYIRGINSKFFNKLNILVDIAFPIVHGTNVEDGNLQGFLHTLNLPVVGPDTLSAAVSMDKYVMKEYFKSIEIPVIPAIRFNKNDYKDIDNTIIKIERELNYPVIVKPVNLGSSIGIMKAKNRNELKNALDYAFSFSYVCLVEKAIINMREINLAILGDKFTYECSALEEPFGNDEILSFADKYMSGSKNSKTGGSKVEMKGIKGGMASLTRKVPADVDKNVENEIKKYGLKAFKYLGLSGVTRIDFIIDKDENKIYLNEINPIPGSLSYYLFEPLQIKFGDLLDKLIKISLDNYRLENNLKFSFENSLI